MPQKLPDKNTRKQQAHQRLGTREPECAICGENDLRCLDKDHLAGRKYSDEIFILCANCHRKRTDSQKDQPPGLPGPVSDLERKGRTIRGAIEHARELCNLLEPIANELIQLGQSSIKENKDHGHQNTQ